jgi:acyl transferase domain-containing protein/glutamate-1-semialdehyde aminotransferase
MKKENEIIEWIVNQISETLSVSNDLVNIDDPFFNLGLNSIDIVDLSKKLETWLGREVEEFLFFEYTTIRSLSEFLGKTNSSSNDSNSKINNNYSNEPMAIIGMDCNFPGAPNLSSFWDLLINKKTGVGVIPDDHFERPLGFTSYAGLIDKNYHFDRKAFKISKEESKHMDPQQKLLLSLSWGAIEDAGYSAKELDQTKTGVFTGISTSDFVLEKILKSTRANVFDGTGFAHSIAANRISYTYNLKGPSLSLDTACSSSLVALHQAIQSIQNGDSDMALVGGINFMSSPFLTQSFQKANMLSKKGKCYTFSNEADGYVRGEGGAVILIKPLSKALVDGNSIYCVVEGTAVNQDGQTSSLTAPNLSSQVSVLNQALQSAKRSTDDIQYIEAHGTATPLGDPIEVEAIKRVYQNKKEMLNIGSVKTNIGHLEAAAGMAGLIKMSLAIKNKLIPGQINFSELNPKINLDGTSIKILNNHMDKEFNQEMSVGISSFGFGGTNSHVILGSAPPKVKQLQVRSLSKKLNIYPLVLSATNLESIIQSIKSLIDTSATMETVSKELLCRHNPTLTHQFAATIENPDDIRKVLKEIEESPNENKYTSFNKKSHPTKVAFVFTGQGSQYNKMGLYLYENFSEFRKKFNSLIDKFQNKLGITNLLQIWLEQKEINNTKFSQILLFTYQASYIDLLKVFNIKADVCLGHSYGEITASYASGLLSERNAIELIYQRAIHLDQAGTGAMLIVFETIEHINKVLNIDDITISLAAMNSKKINVLSGTLNNILKAADDLKTHKIRTKILTKENAFHSYVITDIANKFKESLSSIKHVRAHTPLISCFENENLINDPSKYWSTHMRCATNFTHATQQLNELRPTHIIEIGPTPTLLPLIKMAQRDVHNLESTLISCDTPDKDSTYLLFNIIYKLLVKQYKVSWKPLLRNYQRHFLKLPVSQIQTICNKSSVSNTIVRKDNMSAQINYTSELTEMIARELEMSREEIDVKAPLIDLGADSLVLLGCLESINEKYQVEITMADVFDGLTTIEKITEYLEVNAVTTIQNNEQESDKVETSYTLPNMDFPPDTDVKELIQQQLNIMSLQLKALSGPQKNLKAPKPIKVKNLETNDLSGKGVLGNFSGTYQGKPESTSDYLLKLITKFNEKTKNSKAHTEKFRKPLTDNRVSAGFRPNLKEAVYPIHFKKASGAYFWDIDDNKYIDFTMGFGVNLFGHSPDFISKSVKKQLENGVAVGPQSDLAGPVAELFCKITDMERVAFLNSGTEAIMTAIRLVRAKTKKETIVIFEGSYHGHFDGVLARKTSTGKSIPVSAGVPLTLTDGIIVLDYNEKESLDYIKENAHLLAAVLIEGVQSRFPEVQPKEFILELRKITADNDIALVVDEVINGFRVHPQGIQGDYGFKADVATYGKVLGGGFPIGAVAGRHEYLDFIDGGHWNFGDASYPPNEITFFAGTFCKHPLAMSASYEVLKKIEQSGSKILTDLNEKTRNLANDLNGFFKEHGIDIKIVYYGSLFRFKFKKNIDWLFYLLNLKGFYIWEGRNMFISTAHSKQDITSFIEEIKKSVNELVNEGYINSKNEIKVITSLETSKTNKEEILQLPMIEPQLRFSDLIDSKDIHDKLSAQISACIEFQGPLQVDVLKNVITQTFKRYDSFNARYDTSLKTITFDTLNTLRVGYIDLSELKDVKKSTQEWLEKNARYVLDATSEPVKIDIIKLVDQKHYISVLAHHLTCDGLSLAFITDEFSKAYNAKIKNKDVKYNKLYNFSNYMIDYDERIQKLTNSKKFWEERLKALPSRIWSKGVTHKKGKRIKSLLRSDQYKKIRMFGYKNKSSLQNTLLISFCEILGDHFDRDDLLLGVPAAGHTSIKETCVGQCVNIVPVQWKRSEADIKDKIAFIKENQLQGYKHSDYPIGEMEKFTKSSFIEVLFNVEPISELPKFDDIITDLISVPISASEYPLIINAMRLDTVLHIEMDYQSELISDIEAETILSSFVNRLLTL